MEGLNPPRLDSTGESIQGDNKTQMRKENRRCRCMLKTLQDAISTMDNAPMDNQPNYNSQLKRLHPILQLHVPKRTGACPPSGRIAHRLGNFLVLDTNWLALVQGQNMGGRGSRTTQFSFVSGGSSLLSGRGGQESTYRYGARVGASKSITY
jgi:hypothetical protein